ncbi:hypothetical protein ACOMHN_062422 [Nucella lapillus]
MPDQCHGQAGSTLHHHTVSWFDLTKSGPYDFLPDYRNPCWRHPQTGDLRCLPYFFLAGFPKCGTTDMYQRIVAHPLVVHLLKEPHWFTRRRFHGDGSASTAWDNHLWPQFPGNEGCREPRVLTADYIRHTNPIARVIMMLRNPTTRLYSAYLYFQKRHKSQETFHELVKKNIAVFNACVRKTSLRHCVYNGSLFTLRLHVGVYSVFIEDWLLRLPRDQMLFIRLEDVHRGARVMPAVFQFLGLESTGQAMKRVARIKERNVGHLAQVTGPLWNETRALLDAFYRPFNDRLAAVLQDRRFAWEDV